MRLGTSVLALAAATVVGSQAYATLTAAGIQLVEVPISAAAKAGDPTLATAHSYDIRVTVPANDDWSSGDLLATTANGATFYNNATFGNQPNSALWPFLPAGEFDTFVTGPNFGSVTVLGRFNPPGGAGTEVFGPTETNVSWGDTIANSAGLTFTAARLTVNNIPGSPVVVAGDVAGAYGHVTGKMGSTGDPLNSPAFTFSIVVPEPTSAGLLVVGLGAIATRRRK